MFQNGFRCFEIIELVNSRWVHPHMVDIPLCVLGTHEARALDGSNLGSCGLQDVVFLFSHAGKCSSPEC